MDSPEPNPSKMHVAALIERHDNHFLIARRAGESDLDRVWQFPRGEADRSVTPESAMRSVIREQLGIEIEIVVCQPPIVEEIDGERVELRYFFCGVMSGDPATGAYEEVRWVPKIHLREYAFDPASRDVADWLYEK